MLKKATHKAAALYLVLQCDVPSKVFPSYMIHDTLQGEQSLGSTPAFFIFAVVMEQMVVGEMWPPPDCQ